MSKNSTELKAAEQLALRIKQYWGKKGHNVKVWIESLNLSKYDNFVPTIHNVRSDLFNGLPRK